MEAIIRKSGYSIARKCLIVNSEKIEGMTVNIANLYDNQLKRDQFPALVRRLTIGNSSSARSSLSTDEYGFPAKKHLGSFQRKYSLAPSQRKALLHSLSLKPGEILAISGPPGTGKTTFVHSIVASLWVAAMACALLS